MEDQKRKPDVSKALLTLYKIAAEENGCVLKSLTIKNGESSVTLFP